MGRFRFNPSSAALVIAAAALFVALGGPAWASSLIGTGQIQNGAITSKKIGHHQVKSINLNYGSVQGADIANNAITSAKVKGGSLTASDIAPDTFLGTDAQAQDSKDLGGRPATDYLVTGTGGLTGASGMVFGRAVVPAGKTQQLLNLGIGVLQATCSTGGTPELVYVSEVSSVNLIDTAAVDGTTTVTTTNGLASGSSYTVPNSTGDAQSVTLQAALTGTTASHVATAWTTGQSVSGSSCLFTGQAITTG